MKLLFKITAISMFFSASMMYAAFVNHNGECHDPEKNKGNGCEMCDEMSAELGE